MQLTSDGVISFLLHFSILLLLVLFFVVFKMKNKKAVHYSAMGLFVSVFVWVLSLVLQNYAVKFWGYTGMVFMNLCFTAVGFVSVFIYFLGRNFAAKSGLRKSSLLLFLLPVVSMVFIWTNDWHHLFFVRFSSVSSQIVRGPYAQVQAILAYALIFMGLFFLLVFSIKNSGFFSRQSILIFIGAAFPLIIDISFVLNLFPVSLDVEAISFAFSGLLFMLAIFKFDFLSITPIALQTVVDHISDSYIVINEYFEVIDFNRAMVENFQSIMEIKRKMDVKGFFELLAEGMQEDSAVLLGYVDEAIQTQQPFSFTESLEIGGEEKTFTVEISPITSNGEYKGFILMMKDITEQKRSFEMMSQAKERLLEFDHLVSLGQLVGGISHNLKTPIMSIAGGLEGLTDLITEYDESIEDPSVTPENHHEIAADMREWILKMRTYCAYMSDVISTVKGQASQLTAATVGKFVLRDLLKRIDILMNHELKKYGCSYKVQCTVSQTTEIKGEINSLVQVMNNLIRNSIDAYEGKSGEIKMVITQQEDMIRFEIRDEGCGIPQAVQEKLFKEMITTKGNHGTGLGLYMSYSTIWGKFEGKMSFTSEEGKGTSFFISIPVVV
ncbi:MAG: histidine kinase N-terminal 7TM domain-containing protein [Oscillospiraceae bacterium]